MTKKEMRKKMLSLRDSLSEKERREKSREIAKRLFTLEEFQKAGGFVISIIPLRSGNDGNESENS